MGLQGRIIIARHRTFVSGCEGPGHRGINRVQGVGRGRRLRIQPESTARPWRTPQSVSWTSKSRALKVKWGGVLTCQSYPKTAEKSARSQILRSCWGRVGNSGPGFFGCQPSRAARAATLSAAVAATRSQLTTWAVSAL